MKVIGSGFGRTGTLSMKKALEQLGFGPCYHMEEVFRQPEHIEAWHKIANGQEADWAEIFAEFGSTVDFPASVYYQEIMATFPDARIIHTVREPDRWYDSTNETIYQAHTLFPRWLQALVKPIGQMTDMQNKIIWQKLLQGSFEDRERAIEIFNEHSEEVERTVPPEKLLIFSVKEGWEPLCEFLDVPVPQTPFPHVNDRAGMLRRFRTIRLITRLGPALAGILLAVAIYFLFF